MSQQQVAVVPALPELPDEVVYYNKWTDYENTELCGLFEPIAFDELPKLAPGSTIWADLEMPYGKVYGLSRVKVESAGWRGELVEVHYKGRYVTGSSRI